MKQVPFWHFWNPMSGFRGGFIFGALLMSPYLAASIAIWLEVQP